MEQYLEQTFTAPTQEKANREADDWWMKQKGVCQVSRTQTPAAWGSSTQIAEWTVTIVYKYD
jgi:hypothetical protein